MATKKRYIYFFCNCNIANFSLFDFFTKGGAQKAQEERIEKYIQEQVDEEIRLRFPQVSGPVLRTQKENKQWTDFINKDKKNGPTNP